MIILLKIIFFFAIMIPLSLGMYYSMKTKHEMMDYRAKLREKLMEADDE